ncbi:MAG: sugar phosphate isomerase/epimerase [Ruminiclostridium sp.]|nr:sugar phosphate isomerase/epimerase [Ruminiclostridium sp.]
MKIGVSSASLYPLLTEDAVRTLGELGIRDIEIFVNDLSETGGAVCDDILSYIREYNMNVVSVHPFSSPAETLFLFSDYQRRVDSMLDLYRRYFAFMQAVDAKLFVLHGARSDARCTDMVYMERFMLLCDIAEEYGATVVQENVHYCKSRSIDFLRLMKRECGERARFVLDIKQAVRAGYDPMEIVDAVGESVVHLHVSDNREDADCLPVGMGNYDIAGLIRALHAKGFDGAMMVELYRSNYTGHDELTESVNRLRNIVQEI